MLFYLPAVGGGGGGGGADEVCVFVCMCILWVWGVRGCVCGQWGFCKLKKLNNPALSIALFSNTHSKSIAIGVIK